MWCQAWTLLQTSSWPPEAVNWWGPDQRQEDAEAVVSILAGPGQDWEYRGQEFSKKGWPSSRPECFVI